MWVDTREHKPTEDGEYTIQTVYGNVSPMFYTVKCGWNTARFPNGTIDDEYPLSDLYVVRWYDMEEPDEVPEKWKEEFWNREENGNGK